MNSRSDHAAGNSGFTLVEMLVCIAILALLMAAFAPALSGSRARTELTGSAHALALALRATRDLAIAQRRPEAFALDTAKRVYQSGNGVPQKLGRDLDVQLVAADAGQAGGAIRFFADGGSSGGVLRLSLEKRRLDVVVDWLTGRISVETPHS
jgi:general secretion pathway protein H